MRIAHGTETPRKTIWFLLSAAFFTGCDGSDRPGESPEFTNAELSQFAASTQILAPADNASVSEAIVTVRADVPTTARATTIELLVDGVAIATDTDGAPWEFDWPAYYWGDDNTHSLALRVTTSTDQTFSSQLSNSVRVFSLVGRDLSFAAPAPSEAIQDVNTFEVLLNALEDADSYVIEFVGPATTEELTTTSLSTVLTDLAVGTYGLRFRAAGSFAGETREGPFSEQIQLRVLRPDLPPISAPQVQRTGNLFTATLAWEQMAPGDTYTVTLNRAGSGQTEELITEDSSVTFTDLPLGEHSWTLRRTNSVGHDSLSSDTQLIEAGTYRKVFSGSGVETGFELRATGDGGAIVLASTTSSEFLATPTTDTSGVPWIFKVDGDANLVWEYFDEDFSSFSDILVLDDGAIVAFGQTRSPREPEFIALKLSAQGDVIWRRNPPVDPAAQALESFRVVEHDSELFALGTLSTDLSCRPECQTTSILSLDSATGDLLRERTLPPLGDRRFYEATSLRRSQSGGWLVGGRSVMVTDPASSNSTFTIARFDEDFAFLSRYVNPARRVDTPIVDLLEAPDGSVIFLSSGQDFLLFMSSFSEDLSFLTQIPFTLLPSDTSRSEELLIDDAGNIGFLSSGANGSFGGNRPVLFSKFDETSLQPVGDFEVEPSSTTSRGRSNASMDDGTVLVLINVVLDGGNNAIVLRRAVVE